MTVDRRPSLVAPLSGYGDPSVIVGQLRKLGFYRYAQYLKSEHWQSVQAEYRASERPQFCACGDASSRQLHHLTYERLGAERLDDLVVLCNACHKRAHGGKFRKPSSKERRRRQQRAMAAKRRAHAAATVLPPDRPRPWLRPLPGEVGERS